MTISSVLVCVAFTVRTHDQAALDRRLIQDDVDEAQRRAARPLEVVEEEHKRSSARRDRPQQRRGRSLNSRLRAQQIPRIRRDRRQRGKLGQNRAQQTGIRRDRAHYARWVDCCWPAAVSLPLRTKRHQAVGSRATGGTGLGWPRSRWSREAARRGRPRDGFPARWSAAFVSFPLRHGRPGHRAGPRTAPPAPSSSPARAVSCAPDDLEWSYAARRPSAAGADAGSRRISRTAGAIVRSSLRRASPARRYPTPCCVRI